MLSNWETLRRGRTFPDHIWERSTSAPLRFSQTRSQYLTRWLQQKQILSAIYTRCSDSLHTQTCPLPKTAMTNPVKNMPYGKACRAAFIPSNQTKISFSPSGQLRLEGFEDNPRLYVVWNSRLAGVGPWRSRVCQAHQSCVRRHLSMLFDGWSLLFMITSTDMMLASTHSILPTLV